MEEKSNGLKKSFKDNQIEYNENPLDINTFNTEWNQKANIINKLIMTIYIYIIDKIMIQTNYIYIYIRFITLVYH